MATLCLDDASLLVRRWKRQTNVINSHDADADRPKL